MQAIEMVVFFIAAVIIGSLIIMFFTTLDVGGIFGGIRQMIFPEPPGPTDVVKVSFIKFHEFVYDCWQRCEFGQTFLKCGTVYVKDGTVLSSEELQGIFQKYNFCLDCNVEVKSGTGEIALPAVVRVECGGGRIVLSS